MGVFERADPQNLFPSMVVLLLVSLDMRTLWEPTTKGGGGAV